MFHILYISRNCDSKNRVITCISRSLSFTHIVSLNVFVSVSGTQLQNYIETQIYPYKTPKIMKF